MTEQKLNDYLDKAIVAEASGDFEEATRYFGLAAFCEARLLRLPSAKAYAAECKQGLFK